MSTGRRWATTGERAARWIERFLVHGEGDYYGRPFRLRRWQRAILWKLFEYDPATGPRRYSRALIGLAKGNGKTELAAAIGLYLLLGDDPLNVGTPDVPVAAASYEQADLLFGTAKAMVTHENCRLAPFVDAFDQELLRKDRPGVMYRVAAAAGTNDGRKPSALLEDEGHEWTGNKVRVHTVLTNGLTKRRNTLGITITTAGVAGADSVAEQLYLRARKKASGDLVDSSYLSIWYEAPEHLDLDDDEQLRAAIIAANPAAGDFWPIERLVEKFRNHEVPMHEFERYHLNRWVNAASNPYLPPGLFGALERREPPPDGTEVWLMFDGSYRRDASALWGAYRAEDGTPVTFRVGLWEPPEQRPAGWQVDRRNVDKVVRDSMRRWSVVRFGLDPYGWHDEADRWAEDYGDEVVIAVATNELKRWSAYCSRYYSLVVTGQLAHDHDGALARHLGNSVPRETTAGTYIQKERRSSDRRIDAAIASIGAVGLMLEHLDDEPEPDATPRIRIAGTRRKASPTT